MKISELSEGESFRRFGSVRWIDRKREEEVFRAKFRGNTTLPETETADEVVFHDVVSPRGRTESSVRPYRKGRFKYMLPHKP